MTTRHQRLHSIANRLDQEECSPRLRHELAAALRRLADEQPDHRAVEIEVTVEEKMTPARPYTLSEVGRLFAVEPSVVKRWFEQKTFPGFTTPGGHRRFFREPINDYITKSQEAPR